MRSAIKSLALGLLLSTVAMAEEGEQFVDVAFGMGINEPVEGTGTVGFFHGFNDHTDLFLQVSSMPFSDLSNTAFMVGSAFTAPNGDIRPQMGFALGPFFYDTGEEWQTTFAVQGQLKTLFELSGTLRAYAGYMPTYVFETKNLGHEVRVGLQFRM